MSCIGTNRAGPALTNCRIAYGVMVMGFVVALVGSFEPQLSGGAYILRWSAFMAGLVPYLVFAAFLPMPRTGWLAAAGVALLLADLLVRWASATSAPLAWGGFAYIVLALAVGLVLGAAVLRGAGRSTPPAAGHEPGDQADGGGSDRQS